MVGVGNAAEAFASFDAEPERFRALITDIGLGKGKTGWDVARHMR